MQTMVNVEVVKGANENNLSVLRRFTKRVQSSGVLPRVRSKRYSQHLPSRNTKRAKHLNFLKKKAITAELIKLGKINEVSKFSRRR
ncbi:MAG: 30S ribosomal protein S21 [bacterium]|nr:30S ribosomal protein S21 [bacterium]